MTADVPTISTDPAARGLILPSYGRPRGVHPPLGYSGYRSTALRHPKQPLVMLPQRLTEVTGPLLGDDERAVGPRQPHREERADRL